MNSFEKIQSVLNEIAAGSNFALSVPEEMSHGDYATNVAFILSKNEKISPKDFAEKIIPTITEKLEDTVSKIEVAGAGFINFYLKDEVRTKEAIDCCDSDLKLNILSGKKVLCEYTDPNPFKLFHIGHLVPNTIGEAISRIYEAVGASVKRINYQGDVGMHVAKYVYGFKELSKESDSPVVTNLIHIGLAYSFGSFAYDSNAEAKTEITEINKKIYNRSDLEINKIYDEGRKISLEEFEVIYKKLGTKFDYYIFESEVADSGKKIVLENVPRVFEESEGAVIYKGEKVGLHTRVFINKEGLPTYEAKEIGNVFKKEELEPKNDISVIVTANEINEYFKVIKSALGEIDKNLASKIKHISHGMLRLPEGKMSSRTGNIIPAEELIDEVKDRLKEKFDNAHITGDEKEKLINDVAVAAIKFSILKIAPGKDIVFDFEKSISFEGDSGPYLQYTHARLNQLILKCNDAKTVEEKVDSEKEIERLIISFKNTLQKSYEENAPQHIVIHLLHLTRAFNTFYGKVRVISEEGVVNKYHLDMCRAIKNILQFGLSTLGIVSPERM